MFGLVFRSSYCVYRQEKDLKDAERAAAKQVKAIKANCNQSLARLAPLLFKLNNSLQDVSCREVPNFAKEAAKKAMKELEGGEKECKAKLVQEVPKPLSFASKEVAQRALTASAVLEDMLKAVKKHQG